MDPKHAEILEEQYSDLFKNVAYTEILKAVRAHKERFAQEMVANCNDYNIPDQQFRNLAYGLKSIDTVLKLMTDIKTLKQAQ